MPSSSASLRCFTPGGIRDDRASVHVFSGEEKKSDGGREVG